MPAAVGVMADSYKPVTIPTSGLIGWWDADHTATFTFSSGTVVSQWRNKAPGASVHFTVPGTGTAPSRSGTQNGRATVLFADTGGNKLVATLLPVGGATMTGVVAGKTSAGTIAADRILSITTGDQADHVATGHAVFMFSNTLTSLASTRASVLRGTIPNTTNTPFVAMSQYDGTNHTMFLNGVAGTPVAATEVFNGPVLRVGYQTTNSHFKGELYEVLIYNRALTSPERVQIDTYLKPKWGTP